MADDMAPALPELPPPSPEPLALSLLGHDLRAALAEVRGQLRQIAELDVPPEAADRIRRCAASGEALERLIDQSIGVCLGQASPDLTERSALSVAGFLADLRLRWEGQAKACGSTFRLETRGPLPDRLPLDRAAVERVIGNLVANALLHGGPGQVRLTVGFETPGSVSFHIEDDGPGFPTRHLAALQRDFALPPEARREGGGIGLQSVRRLVEAMGGQATLRNRSTGRGAEVLVCLPETPGPVLDTPPSATGTRLDGWSVLVVDDSDTCREILAGLLARHGAAVQCVGSAAQAQTLLQGGGFDLALVDQELPDGTGDALIAALRADPGPWGPTALLALTAHGDDRVLAALSAAGADGILRKPVLCPITLSAAADQALRARGLGLPFSAAPLARLRELAGASAGHELLARLREDLSAVREGLATGDAAQVRAQSHVLIALAGTAGAVRLHAMAQELNRLAQAGQPGVPPRLLAGIDLRVRVLLDMLAREPDPQGREG